MSYKEKYLKLGKAYNTGRLRESYINHTKETISQLFLDNPSAKMVRFNDSEEEQWVWIVEDTKNSSVKKIVMPPDESIEAGWIVHWNDEQWLCTQVDKSNKEIYQSGVIEKCNAELKWVDEEGVVQSHPCVFYYGTRANFGTVSDSVMSLPDGRRQVVVQKNEHTVKINRNYRFIFGNSAFIVIDHDTVSDEGVVNINLKGDQVDSARDNLELGIADYYGRVNDGSNGESDDDVGNEDLILVIKSNSSTPNEIRRNQSKQYYVELNGEVIEDDSVLFEIYADDQVSATSLALIAEQSNGTCVVKNNGANSGWVQLKAQLTSDPTVFAWLRIQMRSLF